MGTKNKLIDAYIAKSADFAQPILRHIREIVHEACPEVEETMKWSHPHFQYKGMLCGMASFKEYCALRFWKGSLIFGGEQGQDAMGPFGRIASIKDLPSKNVLLGYIRKARQLNDDSVKIAKPPRPTGEKKELVVPDYFQAALKKNKKALTTFEKFSYTKKKDYLEWVTEAKTDETRKRRIETSVEWLAAGKSRNWKYESRC